MKLCAATVVKMLAATSFDKARLLPDQPPLTVVGHTGVVMQRLFIVAKAAVYYHSDGIWIRRILVMKSSVKLVPLLIYQRQQLMGDVAGCCSGAGNIRPLVGTC